MEEDFTLSTEVKNVLLGLLIIAPYLLASLAWSFLPEAVLPPVPLLLWVLLLYPFLAILVIWIINLRRGTHHE